MKSYVKSFEDFLNEEGVAYATQGATIGMGAVVSPGVNTCPGVPGSAGSGDFGAAFTPASKVKNTIYKGKTVDHKGTKRYPGKDKAISQLKMLAKTKKTPDSRVKSLEPGAVQNFSDFINKFK